MSRQLVFAANWKMHLGPDDARAFARRFTAGFVPNPVRRYWFFPPAVSIEATATAFNHIAEVRTGVQDVYWEPKGAFTGATSVPLAQAAGATVALIGHSERRHVFGESEAETAKKMAALVRAGVTPLLCVGEKLEDREQGRTEDVVLRQLGVACESLDRSEMGVLIVAYEPVWAIGTGRNATPADAAKVHRELRHALLDLGHPGPTILYGGSVNAGNVAVLLAEPELDGVLVGGASLDPDGWRKIVETDVAS